MHKYSYFTVCFTSYALTVDFMNLIYLPHIDFFLLLIDKLHKYDQKAERVHINRYRYTHFSLLNDLRGISLSCKLCLDNQIYNQLLPRRVIL